MATDATGRGPEAGLVAAYRVLMRRLNRLARRAEARGATGTEAYIRLQLREIRAALQQAEQAEQALVGEALPGQYERSAAAAQLSLEQVEAAVLEGSFTGVDRAAIRFMQERTSERLVGVREALTEGLALGSPPREAARAIQAAIEGDSELVCVVAGQLKVLTPSGKFWDPAAYSRMLGRTAVADVRRVAFRQRYLQNGVDVVKVVANGSVHDVCQRWEGEQLSLTGATPGLPTVEDARAAGLFHPNCRHRYVVDRKALREAPVPEESVEVPPPTPALPILGRAPAGPRAAPRPRVPAAPRGRLRPTPRA